jgi:predicted short-subunit dehydrogenase-like oxidoreductase (DUF2520 family)
MRGGRVRFHRVSDIIGVIGRGRVGTALSAALASAGERVVGPLGREDPTPPDAGVIILAVPDAAIAAAAARIPEGPLLAHCSASAPLALLGDREAFSLHPLLAVTGIETTFAGAGCAVAGNSRHAVTTGERLARRLGMQVAEVRDEDRALYHAAASLAANFLVTLEGEAERLMAQAGVERAILAPLVRAAVDAWARQGAAAALTGPIVRGDERTVQRQRDALAARAPELLPMWDALAARTRVLASGAQSAREGATRSPSIVA